MQVKITTQENMQYYNCAKNTLIDIELEKYVGAVVASEVGNAPIEAAKAQAVAARTFAIQRGVLDGKPISDSASVAQAFRAKRLSGYETAHLAAELTSCEILEYCGKPISAVFSQSNGGRVRSSQEVWGTEYPYLVSKDDPWDRATKNGHGVGMSQTGANDMALWGKSYKEILEFYYPGAKLRLCAKAVFARIRTIIEKISARI